MTTPDLTPEAIAQRLNAIVGALERNGGWANATPVLRSAASTLSALAVERDKNHLEEKP